MMDKATALKQIKESIKAGEITKKELLSVYLEAEQESRGALTQNQKRLSNILYFIGGGIVFLGICIFVGQNWRSLNGVTKILSTLGAAIAMYVSALLVNQHKNLQRVSESFYFLSALIAPLGIFVTMDLAGFRVNTAGYHSVVAAIVLVTYLVSYLADRKTIFLIFSIIFGTWLFFSLTTFLIGGRSFQNWDFVKYRWLTCGLSYMCLACHYQETKQHGISSWLYGSGIFSFLTAAFMLAGWVSHKNIFWEIVFPGLSFGAVFLSIYLRVKSFLVIGTMYLMFYILRITGEYFSRSVGWPLALIFAGFALIGIGYLAVYLHKRYMNVI